MSFQYIAYRYDTGSKVEPPKDSTARSTGLPAPLEAVLEGISVLKQPANVGILGPQYAYRLADAEGEAYHILSCVRGIKDPETGAHGSLSHHVILTEAEVQELSANGAHPTPSGIILALDKNDLWHTEDTPHGIQPDKPITFTAAALPDAAPLSTWKKITGCKGHARSLHLKDYQERCILMLPTPTDARDALMLMHESDWPVPGYGWGRTFTTYGVAGDDAKDTNRIFLPIGSLTATNEAWQGIPCLCVNERMNPGEPEAPVGAYAAKPEHIPHPDERRVAPENPEPYRYVEVDDARMFHVPFQRLNPLLRYGMGVGILLLVSAVVYAMTSVGIEDTAEAGDHPLVPEKPALPVPPPAPKGSEKVRTAERVAVPSGHKLPAKLKEALTSPKTLLALQPLTPGEARIRGAVMSAEETSGGMLVQLRDADGAIYDIRLHCDGQKLCDIRYRGKPAVLFISTPRKEIALLPRISISLPETAGVRLPDAEFDFTPDDLKLDRGHLRCLRKPPVAKANALAPRQTPFLLLPQIPDCRHSVTCAPPKDMPHEVRAEVQPPQGGLQVVSVELLLCDPFNRHFTRHFDMVTSAALIEEMPTATMANIFEMTRKMKGGDLDAFDPEAYGELKNAAAGKVRLPDYSPDMDFVQGIEEALCAKINRDCLDFYEHCRRQAENYRKPLILELRGARFTENGTAMHWIFELREVDGETTTPPAKAPVPAS